MRDTMRYDALFLLASRLLRLIVIPLTVANAVISPMLSELYARGELEKFQKLLKIFKKHPDWKEVWPSGP